VGNVTVSLRKSIISLLAVSILSSPKVNGLPFEKAMRSGFKVFSQTLRKQKILDTLCDFKVESGKSPV
jgi:hypothetical protein